MEARIQKSILEKAQYWLRLAANPNRDRYQQLCSYKMACGYFFSLRNKHELLQIIKKRPDIKGLLRDEIVEFCDRLLSEEGDYL